MYGSVLSGGLAGHVHGTGAYDLTSTGEPAGWRPYIWDALRFGSGGQMRHLAAFVLSEQARYQQLLLASEDLHPRKAPGAREDGLDGWAFMMRTADRGSGAAVLREEAPSAGRSQDFGPPAAIAGPGSIPAGARWAAPSPLASDRGGSITVPAFPGGPAGAREDWAAKLVASGGGGVHMTTSMRMLLGSVLLAVGAVAGYANESPSSLALQTERVIAFKDGYSLIVKSGTALADDKGEVHTDEVPEAAILGAFWAFAEREPIAGMRVGWRNEETVIEEAASCLEPIEILDANRGKACRVVMGDAREYSGIVRDVLTWDVAKGTTAGRVNPRRTRIAIRPGRSFGRRGSRVLVSSFAATLETSCCVRTKYGRSPSRTW